MRESAIENHLVREAKRRGGIVVKLNPGGMVGIPDRMVIPPGRPVAFVELKKPKGSEFRENQKLWGARLMKMGHPWYLCPTKQEVDIAIREIFEGRYPEDR